MKKILRLLTILFFVILFIGTLMFLWNKTTPKQLTFTLVKPTYDTLMNKTIATGNIEPRDEVLIKPQISGIISEIYCEAGDMVKKDDVIARVKVIPEMGALNSAQSRVKVSEINIEQIQREYNRVEELYAKGVLTIEEFEQAETTLKKVKEDLQNAKDNLEIVEKGMTSRSASMSNTQIRATVTGMVLDVPIKVGNSVIQSNTFNDGTTIAIIADLNNMLFVGDVDETEIGKLKEGMATDIIIGALQGVKLKAHLEYISPKAEEKNGIIVFEIKAATIIPDSIFIRSGYSANGSIITELRENVLAIPEAVVQFKNDSSYVEILTSEDGDIPQIFERKDIKLGFSNGVKVEVLSGLEGEENIKGNVII